MPLACKVEVVKEQECQNAEEKDQSNFSYDTGNACSWFYCFNTGPT